MNKNCFLFFIFVVSTENPNVIQQKFDQCQQLPLPTITTSLSPTPSIGTPPLQTSFSGIISSSIDTESPDISSVVDNKPDTSLLQVSGSASTAREVLQSQSSSVVVLSDKPSGRTVPTNTIISSESYHGNFEYTAISTPNIDSSTIVDGGDTLVITSSGDSVTTKHIERSTTETTKKTSSIVPQMFVTAFPIQSAAIVVVSQECFSIKKHTKLHR